MVDELSKAQSLFDKLLSEQVELEKMIGEYRQNFYFINSFVYPVVRMLKPECVVETGVSEGTSSAFCLKALFDNSEGHLYSIDLPNARTINVDGEYGVESVPSGRQTGYLIPEKYRSRWTLIEGDSREELPRLVESLDSIGIFFHDSLHTYEHMIFEFGTVWSKLRNGGALMSDDVEWNNAFAEFCRGNNANPKIIHGVGFSLKEEDSGKVT